MAEKQQASPLILLAIYGTVNFFYEDKTHSPASYAHTTHNDLEMMPSVVMSLGKFPCFIFYCLISKRYSNERFFSLLASARFLHCHTFVFTTWNFLAALQLCFLSTVDHQFKLCSHLCPILFKMQVAPVDLFCT